MSFSNKLKTFFSTYQETNAKHHISGLKSHYYKTTYKNALHSIQSIIKQTTGMAITSNSKERGEISANIVYPKMAF
jgi:hypothetical protein